MRTFRYSAILILVLGMQLQSIGFAKGSADRQTLVSINACADVITFATSSAGSATILSSGLIPFNPLAFIVSGMSALTSVLVGKHSKEWCTKLDQKSAKSSI